MTQILLVDNGSSRPESTLQLRRLAAALGERLATPVYPVSLQHADKVPPKALDGVPADTFEPFLCRALQEGQRDFLAVPLFFGPSRALTQFIPEMVSDLAARLGPLHLRIAPELCPLPAGEPRLADILADQARATATAEGIPLRRVVLVDHGSPLPEVSAVRQWLAERLRHRLGDQVELRQAVMERRPGAAYDFNGRHLSDTLAEMAREDPQTPVILALLFLAPGRHAGAGGDIATIAAAAQAAHPGFRVHPSPLVGEHPALIGILADRVIQGRLDAVKAPAGP